MFITFRILLRLDLERNKMNDGQARNNLEGLIIEGLLKAYKLSDIIDLDREKRKRNSQQYLYVLKTLIV